MTSSKLTFSQVTAKQVGDSLCSVSDNSGFFTGAAGMIGYSITSNGKTMIAIKVLIRETTMPSTTGATLLRSPSTESSLR
jgi:hypothetical protein